ncbi:odorant receptor 59b-like [Drosophila novamexicana]|uniref:odorant receptor 59b-like n=1 Tax=Drosophila novamexicana TaxID=47314 RepID=UPI0011E5D3DA|nr:odorant receptor 59b-like [Drosophila novamexicana]
MTGIFRLTYTAALSARIRSRESCTYLYRVMKLMGWIAPKQGIKRYMYLAWMCLVFLFPSLYLPFGLGLSLIYNFENFTPSVFLSVLQMAFNVSGATVKSYIVYVYMSRLNQTRSIMDALDERLQSDSDRMKIHKAVASSNYLFMVYAVLYISYTVSVFVVGLANRQPPWMIYNPFFDWRKGVASLWLHAMLEYILMVSMTILVLIIDTYTLVFIINFRAHIDVLKDHIRNLRTDPLQTEAKNYDELVYNIIYHKLIVQCCNLMRPVMSQTIFIQFLLVGVVLGVTMINVLYFSGLFRAISSILFVTALLFETFPFCYLCDQLVNDCYELSNLLGESHWIDAEPKYKSTLKFFMHNLQQPIIFTAGGIFLISLNSNIQVAKFAFSVMTIVQQMNLADRFK